MIDPATTTKMTVQFNLFGGTVFRLGTERHHHLLDGIDSLEVRGRNFHFDESEIASDHNRNPLSS